ncbi:signal recognition particle protein [Candidatus Woesearchaeota archaeon CG07_land_8_20_14_0_80_44_23]|nr:MAG: signal recognition particle protein [Candidatus Woesearchaeota archaeon CG07_land_8_20_14_0_80_44_23]
MLDKLGDSLKGVLKKISQSIFVDEKLINELVKEIQRALLQSDVDVKLVFELSKRIKERALREEVPGLTKKEHLINIVYAELVNFLGGEGAKIEIRKKNFKIMLVGLYASGKTTQAGKLARFFQKRGFNVALLQTDIYRPAGFEQLSQLGKSINVPVYGDLSVKDSLKIYKKFEQELSKYDLVIIDTAGRDALSEELIKEVRELYDYVKPDENLLVISADIGQTAMFQAEQFHANCKITGVVVTKLEGTAKGGGAISACAATGTPVKFVGVGEKIEDIEEFNPPGFVSRLLGMGDINALLEKAKEAISQEDAESIKKKMLKGDFNLIDLYEQMQAVRKMGPLSNIFNMIPGFSQAAIPKDMLSVQEEKLQKWKYIMDSMSRKELEEPDSVGFERMERIARGSGASIKEVRELLKQYKQSKKLVKAFSGGSSRNMEQLVRKMGKMQGVKGMKLK